MKILTLGLMFFCTQTFASLYMSKLDAENCGQIGYKYRLYAVFGKCRKDHADCVDLPKGFNCKTYSEQDTQVDDRNSPKATKSEIDTCLDQSDCESRNAVKTCLDPIEQVKMALDYSDIYCTKPNGFNQMTVKQIRLDLAKKATWDINPINPVVKRALRKTRREQIATAISTIDGMTLGQLKAVVKKIMRDKYTKN